MMKKTEYLKYKYFISFYPLLSLLFSIRSFFKDIIQISNISILNKIIKTVTRNYTIHISSFMPAL